MTSYCNYDFSFCLLPHQASNENKKFINYVNKNCSKEIDLPIYQCEALLLHSIMLEVSLPGSENEDELSAVEREHEITFMDNKNNHCTFNYGFCFLPHSMNEGEHRFIDYLVDECRSDKNKHRAYQCDALAMKNIAASITLGSSK